MPEETSVQDAGTRTPRSRRKLAAMIAACGLVLAGGIIAVSATASGASAEETTRQCSIALSEGAAAAQGAVAADAKASKALETVKGTTLPKGAGTSTLYAQRPAVKGANAVPARASGADFIGGVAKTRAALTGITVPTGCTDRDQAADITAATAQRSAAARALDTRAGALLADFAVFQADESKRLAAEKKAAAEKEAAAKKKAASEAAAKQKAADEAAEAQAREAAAAAQAQVQEIPQYAAPEPAAGGGSYVPTPAPYVPAPAPYIPAQAPPPYVPAPAAPAPPHRGGGGVVTNDGSNKVCWTSNGMGGTMPCP